MPQCTRTESTLRPKDAISKDMDPLGKPEPRKEIGGWPTQSPVMKEYALDYNEDPYMIERQILNGGFLEAVGIIRKLRVK